MELNEGKPYNFIAYSIGLCYASVCSSLNESHIAEQMNREHMTGISSKWKISEDKFFNTGEPNPSECPDYPRTHKHYLLSC